MNPWGIEFKNIQDDDFGLCESLFTLCNGYFAMRGSLEEFDQDIIHYPGIYIAGLYDTLASEVNNKKLLNEDLVNCPNPLFIRCAPVGLDKEWNIANSKTTLNLDLRNALLERTTELCDKKARKTIINSRRLVSMASPNLAALQYMIRTVNWSGEFILDSGIIGNIVNAGVPRYAGLNNKHLKIVDRQYFDSGMLSLLVETIGSHTRILTIIKHKLFMDGIALKIPAKFNDVHGFPSCQYRFHIGEGAKLRLEKIISVSHYKVKSSRNFSARSIGLSDEHQDFECIYQNNKEQWRKLWNEYDINLGNAKTEQKIIRLHIFHLLQTCSKNAIGLDVGVPARAWHGEAYRGHIFWDEIFVLPFLSLHSPELARSALMYRYHRLNVACQQAKKAGYEGAMFPWQSAESGEEVSQVWHLNPLNGQWVEDFSSYQRHVGCAIAYNVWHYFQITGDESFLYQYGLPLLIEISRFLVSLSEFNHKRGLYEIKGVIGPDEFHEQYPQGELVGVNNNAYTNIMTVWVLSKTLEFINMASTFSLKKLKVSKSELKKWLLITKKMFVPFHDGIISQFEGFERLKELDWNLYRDKYGNISRMDRILKSENDSVNNYQVTKQADVNMLFYLLPRNEIKSLFANLKINLSDECINNTIQYYYQRCSHGSTLSKVVYASVLDAIDSKLSAKLYLESLKNDYLDVQKGSTREGIHLGFMGASVYHLVKHFLGFDVDDKKIIINPCLPNWLDYFSLKFKVLNSHYCATLHRNSLEIESLSNINNPIMINNSEIKIKYAQKLKIKI